MYKHITIWLIYSFLLFSFYLIGSNTSSAIIHTVSFVGNQLLAFYLNHYFLLPKTFEKRKYITYAFSNIILILFGAFSNTFIEGFFGHKSEHFELNLESLYAHSLPTVLAIFIAFIIYTYLKRLKQEQKELELLKSEKNFLIQQINPHFLFNTLNNIYSLTIENNPKGSEAVMQLSKMLDYSLYGNKHEFVSIIDEKKYIENFIKLFSLKDEEIDGISFTTKNINIETKIAPMLLIPFVENAFKHGNIEENNIGKIAIELFEDENEINFSCVNTFREGKKIDQIGGIGIVNVTRRLELIYPKKYDLNIEKKEGLFKVYLKIKKK
ncbi:sensor histidine kinase [Aureivirga sp. CE67]|uniref:sensor histidine kinase n=1 Tax=Aureivirga sp. CE67 TaxID=1788983 RepID=UPI0018C968D1|nr:histidine kinase [Aureivirga sp. CE67]